jgi:hypothetical protein
MNINITVTNTNNRLNVHFSTEIRYITVPHRSELPCTQQYYADYIVCQRHHIEHTYIQQHGTLIGFNYTALLESHKNSETILEKEWFPDKDKDDDKDDKDDKIKIDK